MSPLQLYKYLSPRGARLTLGNGTFRFAKPSDFDDDMDMTIQNIFPVEIEAALNLMANGLHRVIFDNLDKSPTCTNDARRLMVSSIQEAIRTNPNAVEIIEKEIGNYKASDIYDVEHMRAITAELVADMNEFLQKYRVLCVTNNNNSIPMWERYSTDHSGIVVRITPNQAKDSKFTLFRKVDYAPSRPTLYESVKKFQEDSLFGDQDQRRQSMIDKIIYTKTLEWQYEREYRFSIPLLPGENYDTMPYHPEELSELYLGAKMVTNEKQEIVDLARKRNHKIKIFQAFFDDTGNIAFRDF